LIGGSRVRNNHTKRLIGWCLLLVTARTVAAGSNDTTDIWRHIDEFVALAPQGAPAGGPPPRNDQPIVIAAPDLAAALAKLRVREAVHEDEAVPLFARDAARRLAVPLSTALSRAAPDQDVLFAIDMEQKAALFGYKPVSVAGRAFYQNDKLQLIIGEVHVTTIAPEYKNYPAGYPQPDRRPHPHRTGERAQPAHYNSPAQFETGAGVRLFVQNGTLRPDWLVINVGLLASAAASAAASPDQSAAIADSDNATGAASPSGPGSPSSTASPSGIAQLSIEERLLRLKRLREQDLITEEEYTRKRREILEQL